MPLLARNMFYAYENTQNKKTTFFTHLRYALKKCIVFFIGFYVGFLSFCFVCLSFYGLKSTKNVVNSKMKIYLRSDHNQSTGLNLRNHDWPLPALVQVPSTSTGLDQNEK